MIRLFPHAKTPEKLVRRLAECRFYGRYIDADGRPREDKLFQDERASLERLRELATRAERIRAGIRCEYEDQRKRPLLEHIEDFRRYLAEEKECSKGHAELQAARIRAVCDGCGFSTLAQLDPNAVSRWLADARRTRGSSQSAPAPVGMAKDYAEIGRAFGVAERTITHWRKLGAPIKARQENDLAKIAEWRRERNNQAGPPGIGKVTSNAYLTAIKSFGNWLVRQRRALENPFSCLRPLNAEDDKRHERRILSDHEFSRLIEAAHSSLERVYGLSGPDRAMLYITAAYTGLRAGELASLSESSLDLDSGLPTAAVKAAYSKRRRRDVQPLRADLARMLAEWLKQRETAQAQAGEPEKRLWPGRWSDEGAEMLRHDLAAAKIPYADEDGQVFDFHSLRHQFISSLAMAGVHPKTAQTLARHSSIKLTLDRYTHLGVCDVAAALDDLPALPVVGQEILGLQVTGTEGGAGCGCTIGAPGMGNERFPKSARVRRQETDKELQERHKPLENQGFSIVSLPVSASDPSEADGNRTRNHRIDSPVL